MIRPGEARALTLWQPWASLVALGVKRIETRSWSTAYRGPLLIHAAKRWPEWATMKALVADRHDVWAKWYAAGLVAQDGSTDHLPLGAVVAVADLVDVVPMVASCEVTGTSNVQHLVVGDALDLHAGFVQRSVDDQRPYGDFAPGRFAWLLDNVRPLPEPIPAKGRQGLWTPSVALIEQVNEQLAAAA